jgi:hypothetical protein
VNTGSVGRPKDGDPRAGYCIVSVGAEGVTSEQVRIDYDIEDTCSSLLKAGLP